MKNLFSTAVLVLIFIFFLIRTGVAQAPANDNCADATTLNVGSSCVYAEFTNAGSTKEATTVAQEPSCPGYLGFDVWYTVTMPTSGALRLETRWITISGSPSVSVFSGTCGNFTEIICYVNDGGKTIVSPSLGGATLYVRVYGYYANTEMPFKICAFEPVVPANDNCADAISLAIGQTCTIKNYSNKYTTKESLLIAPNPGCQGYSGGDVWFTFTMPVSGSLRLQVDNLENAGPLSMVLYSGMCGNFVEEICISIDQDKTIRSPLLGGKKLYLRMYRYISEEGNDFQLCLFEPQIPLNDDCESSINLPVTLACEPVSYSNAFATSQSIATAANPTCGQYRGGDVWFNAIVPSSGVLALQIEKPSGSGLSVAVYSGVCGNLTEVACFSLNKKPMLYEPALAGKKVLMRIYSYGTEEGGSFSFCAYEPMCIPIQTQKSKSICQGESFSFGSLVISDPGIYSQSFESAAGCDSLVNLTVTVNPTYFIQDTVIVCNGGEYTFHDGYSIKDVIESVTHISKLKTIFGCDSIFETTVEVHLINIGVVLDGATLTAETSGAQYQWMDCNLGNLPIAGETNETFTPVASGSYSVVIKEYGCEEISSCYPLIITVVEDDLDTESIKVYPNPSNEQTFINFPKTNNEATLKIIDLSGQVLFNEEVRSGNTVRFRTAETPAGVYIVRVVVDGKIQDTRHVIVH